MNPLTFSILYSLFVENRDKNWVFSPASYLEAMSLLSLCIKDENLSELTTAAPDIAQPQTAGLDTSNYLLYAAEYANAMDSKVKADLVQRGAALFGFSNPDHAVSTVNALVDRDTHGKIKDLLTREDLTERTKFIILNCVYFNAKWQYKLSERSWTEPFVGATKTSRVRFLGEQHPYRYYEGVGYDIVEMPYRDSDVACYLVVPTTASLFDLFSDLKGCLSHLPEVRRALDVNLTVPAFKVETTIPLNSPTKGAGVRKIFEWSQDWTLVDWSKVDPQTVLQVEKILQKAMIDFTKDGTEVAAATYVSIGLACSGCGGYGELPKIKTVRADKPFLYVLANRTDFKPLFVGVVNDVPDAVVPSPTCVTGQCFTDYVLGGYPALSGFSFRSL